MTTTKFDNHDRQRVVSEIENHYQVKLHKVGSREKSLQDQTGKSYWILGGTGDWHGIPKEMFTLEEKQSVEGVLVIAKRKLHSIDIFVGSLSPLIKLKESLCQTEKDYQFNVRTSGDAMNIKEAHDVRLKKISTIDYSAEEKVGDRAILEIHNLIKGLPEAERKTLLRKIT